jgi:hypothetical protein
MGRTGGNFNRFIQEDYIEFPAMPNDPQATSTDLKWL